MDINSIKTKDSFHNYVTIKQSDNTSTIEVLLCDSKGSLLSGLNEKCTVSIYDAISREIRQISDEQIVDGVLNFKIVNDLLPCTHKLEVTTFSGVKFPADDDFQIFVSESHNSKLINVIKSIPTELALKVVTQQVMDRFNGISNNFINYIKKGEVSVRDIDKNKGLLDGTFFTSQFIEELKGGQINTTNVLDGAITTLKLADKAITPEKTTFFTGTVPSQIIDPNNLFNISTVQTNKTIDTDGTVIEDTSRWLTDFIELDSEKSEQLNFTLGSYRIGLYDSNKKFIIRTGVTNDTKYISIPSTKSKFVRLSGTTPLDKMMVNKGKELLPLESKEVTNTESTPTKMKKEYIPEITAEMLAIMESKVSNNLLNKKEVQLNKTVETDGSIVEDASRWLTGFIQLDSQTYERLNFTQGTYRIAMYDADKKFIIRSGITNNTFYVPSYTSRTKYVRLSGTTNLDILMINKGEKLLPYEDPFGKSIKIKGEYLPDNLGRDSGLDEETKNKLDRLDQNIQTYTPNIPKLNFEEVKTGYNEALWLSSDGKRIYGKRGSELWVSFDECKNLTVIIPDAKFSIQAVRELEDGELIFSTERDSAGRTQNGRVYKTKGFNKETGKIDSYEMKIETDSTEAKINNSWGITTYKNIVTVSEYGLRTEEGARRAWLSTDYGNTFKLIFDQKETTKIIEGAPTWTETAHMHTCSFDPYWNRIWIVTGDRPNSATYYSDDFGETWKWVDVKFNGDVMQFTGIIALPNCVVFGSDRAPNGVFVYYRGNKSDIPKIVPLLLVNDRDIITHVFQLPFKKDWDSLSPVYFAATNAGETDNKSILVSTVDGKKAFILHENNNNEKFGGKCTAFLGETAKGNVIGTFFDSDVSGYRIGKAKAPIWTKL